MMPDDRRMAVFRRGIWKGLKGLVFDGGQYSPNSTVGVSLL